MPVVGLQKNVQLAGAKSNDPVLYSYAHIVEGQMRLTVGLLMDARYMMMDTVGNRTNRAGNF